MTKSLQICFGASAGGSLFAGGFDAILAYNQVFEGPLDNLKTYEDFENALQIFLNKICGENFEYQAMFPVPLFSYLQGPNRPMPLTSSEFIKIINESDDVVVWLSLCFQEQLMLAFLIHIFTLYSLPLEKLKVRRIETQIINGKLETILAIAMIPPAAMKAADPATSLDSSEIDLLIKGWEAFTSSNPNTFEDYLGLPPTSRLQEGLKDYRTRMPSPKTGLNRCQTELLEAYPLDKDSINANYLIGTVLGRLHVAQHLDLMGHLNVEWNLMQMTNLHAPRPAFTITNPYTREHQVAITDYGRTLREGKANWLDDNPVDYYVGGLHIHSTPPSPQRHP